MTCRDCLRAQQIWNWASFAGDCTACQIRAIAGSPQEIREGAYDQALKREGFAAMQEIKRSVAIEVARIVALKNRVSMRGGAFRQIKQEKQDV